jgi:hypothetical protein
MRHSPDLRIFRSRIAQVFALGGLITTASCKDATAPERVQKPGVPTPSLAQAVVGDDLGALGSSLDDMTAWSLASLPDGKGRQNIVGILEGLRGHLKTGKLSACQQDITDARNFIDSLNEQQRVEIGAVGVTLDVIQSALDKAAQ